MGVTRRGNARVESRHGTAAVAAGVTATAAFLFPTACDKQPLPTPTQTTTSTSATASSTSSTSATKATSSSPAAKADYGNVAVGMLDAIAGGDYAAATLNFDSALKKKLTASQLSASWATVQQQLGAYQSHGSPQQVEKGDSAVVKVPLQMQKGAGAFEVAFREKDGKVSGIKFLKVATSGP